MKRTIFVRAVASLMVAANVASADIVQGIAIDFVTIGNPGNPGDTRTVFPTVRTRTAVVQLVIFTKLACTK
jgi:hypothetical protein